MKLDTDSVDMNLRKLHAVCPLLRHCNWRELARPLEGPSAPCPHQGERISELWDNTCRSQLFLSHLAQHEFLILETRLFYINVIFEDWIDCVTRAAWGLAWSRSLPYLHSLICTTERMGWYDHRRAFQTQSSVHIFLALGFHSVLLKLPLIKIQLTATARKFKVKG